ncbi:MAG: MetS family NSS transporter small subunit [Candidatus Krumholzibacteriota bacterium]|nr:MetS family NSS transporter small subunit [Candidatus Krumholzibacteriota bacterium]
MTGSAIIMMCVICGLVWGGFTGFLVFVMRMERKRKNDSESS